MSEKMILPTDAMAAAGHEAGEIMQRAGRSFGSQCRWAIYAALNHPDARGLFTDEDDRPWEPLNGRPVRVGDEVRRELDGINTTAVVGRVDEVDALWTAGGTFIGRLDSGTWYVRRAVQELPTKRRTVIIANDGHEYIEAVVGGVIWRTSEAILGLDRRWHGVWRAGSVAVGSTSADSITPGTWKVGNR